jgi:hypothetical protein
MPRLISLGSNGVTYTDDSSRSAKQTFLDAVAKDPSAIGIGFRVTSQGGATSVSKEVGYSPVDQQPVDAAIRNFASRVKPGSLATIDASRGPVDVDSLAPYARIQVPAGGKLQLQGTGDYRLPAYVSAESASPAHDRSVGIQAFAGKGVISYELPLTGKPGSFEIEVAVPFASHEDVWNATKLTHSHMTAGLSADSAYLRKRFFVDVVDGQSCAK